MQIKVCRLLFDPLRNTNGVFLKSIFLIPKASL